MLVEVPDDSPEVALGGVSSAPVTVFFRRDTATAVVLAVRGEIDLSVEDEFVHAMLQAVHDAARDAAPVGGRVLVLDLKRVTFIGSTGISVLLRGHHRAGVEGVELRVVTSSHPGVRRVVGMLGLGQLLSFYSSRRIACATAVPGTENPQG